VLPSSVLLVLPVNGVSTATEYRMFERQVLRGLSVKVLICQVLIIEKIRAIIGSHFCLSRFWSFLAVFGACICITAASGESFALLFIIKIGSDFYLSDLLR
jgi:hypothetical protein